MLELCIDSKASCPWSPSCENETSLLLLHPRNATSSPFPEFPPLRQLASVPFATHLLHGSWSQHFVLADLQCPHATKALCLDSVFPSLEILPFFIQSPLANIESAIPPRSGTMVLIMDYFDDFQAGTSDSGVGQVGYLGRTVAYKKRRHRYNSDMYA